MEERFEELSRVQTMEQARPSMSPRETRRGIEMVEVATGIPSLMMGITWRISPVASTSTASTNRSGFFATSPFNFHSWWPLWFSPFAMATGNTFVVKPSPRDPISQVKSPSLMDEAGIPPGVYNVVHGANEASNALLEHPNIKGVTFVGSTPVGRDIVYKKCGETGKRVIAQCGAKNFYGGDARTAM